MSNSQPNKALFLPFGGVEFNDAGDVVKIVLRNNKSINYKGKNWRKVADAIVRSPALREITLKSYDDYGEEYDSFNQNALAAVFGRKRTHPCAMEEFSAESCVLGPEDLAIMLPFFKSTPEIKTIHFGGHVRDKGTILLSEVLNHTRVENLNLCDNKINGKGLGRLFSAKNSKHLHKLDLEDNEIGTYGQEAICRFLQRDDTEMRKLHFDFVDQDQFRTVLKSISPHSKLVELINEEGTGVDPDEESKAAMSTMLKNAVCNTDTFEDLCESNHQLAWVGPHMCKMLKSDPVLKKAITINNQFAHGASVISRLRSKLRAFYFQGQFDVQPFIDMDVVLMPFVLALVTKTERVFPMDNNDKSGTFSELAGGKCFTVDEGDLGSVYNLVRNCHLPDLFDFPSSKSRIQKYESRILSLEEDNARLVAENEELRSQFGRPSKKRAKK